MTEMLLNQGKLEFSKMRDIEQLRKVGIDLSTSSNEVAKLWDAILFQSYAFFDAPETDGIQGCISKIKSLDPSCPLIRTMTLDTGIENFDIEIAKLNSDLRAQYTGDINLDRKWTQFEKTQIQISLYRLEGYDDLAANLCFKQLAKKPLDLMTLKTAMPLFILKGSAEDLSILAGYSGKALARDNIYYPFVKSYEAFGLEERGQLTSALKIAEDCLTICPWTSWATHTIAHVFDSQGRPDKGIAFLDRTRQDWTPSTFLTCHNNWHAGLFHLDNYDIGEALRVWDTEIITRLQDQFSYFQMSDAVSLLSRIEMEQCSSSETKIEFDITNRWNDLLSFVLKSTELETFNNFFDAHLALAMMGSRQPQALNKINDRIKDWLTKYENRIFEEWETDSNLDLYSAGFLKSNRFVTRNRVLIPLVNSMIFFDDGDYQSAVNALYPIRHQLKDLGGSKAQRDVFLQFLSSALLMAGGEENISLLKMLLFERKEQRVDDNYNDRMQRKILDSH